MIKDDDDYIPGVTPYKKPTEQELGFKPLSDEEFEKVKENAAKTKDERWKDLGEGKTEQEFEENLAREKAWLKQFEHAQDDPNFVNNSAGEPLPGPWYVWTFEQIGNFFNKLIGKK